MVNVKKNFKNEGFILFQRSFRGWSFPLYAPSCVTMLILEQINKSGDSAVRHRLCFSPVAPKTDYFVTLLSVFLLLSEWQQQQ